MCRCIVLVHQVEHVSSNAGSISCISSFSIEAVLPGHLSLGFNDNEVGESRFDTARADIITTAC